MALSGDDRALLRACKDGDTEQVRALLDAGADVAAQSSGGNTPLHLAAIWGHAGIATLLLDAGADPAALNNLCWTPLHHAVYGGHTDIAALLLDAEAGKAATAEGGETPEDIARGRGHTALADLLREAVDAAKARRLAEPVVTGIDWAALVD